ncbi:MAG: AMP-binding protein [Rhodospirillales bacterium]
MRDWSIPRLLDDMAGRGDRPAVVAVCADRLIEWSYRQVADHALRLAAGLRERGLGQDEPVAIVAPNMPEWIVVGLAIAAAGGTVVPIDDLAADGEAATIVTDSGARIVFTVDHHLQALRGLPADGGLGLFRLDRDGSDDGAPGWRRLLSDHPAALPEVDAGRPMSLFYTSGTTGAAKAFHLSHANIAANVTALAALAVVAPGDRALLPLPLHHVYPWVVGVLTALTAGLTVVLPEAATGPAIVHALQTAGVTVVIGVPRLYEALLAGVEARAAAAGAPSRTAFAVLMAVSAAARRRLGIDLGRRLLRPVRRRIGPDVRLLVSGGARLEPATIVRLEALGWEVLSGYGLAETASIFTANVPDRKRLGSEGRPITSGRLRIADADETGIGEIQVCGPAVFGGYRNNPDANRDAFTADGWFRTGDLGCLDDDGYVTVTGRAKELIVLGGGKNINPEELENAYGAHPFVAEIAVFERAGGLVALVRPDPAALREAGATRIDDAVRVALTSVAHTLPSHRRLTGFAVVRDPLPRTRLGKVRRFRLPQLYDLARAGREGTARAAPTAADRALLAVSPAKDVWRLLGERCGKATLSLESSPALDLGMDSFAWMTFVVELEKRTGIRLTEDDIARVETVGDLIAAAGVAADRASGGSSPVADEAGAARWLKPVGPAHRVAGVALYGLNRLVMRILFRLRVEGRERVPAAGACVLAANHASDLDPLALAAALPLAVARRTYWAGDVVRLFSTAAGRWLCRAAHVYPVDERRPGSVMAIAEAVLGRGHVQVWFPEAWRSPDGELQRFLPGIGKLLADTGVPVVPIYIAGSFEALPRHRRWPRLRPLRVVFGPPIAAGELAGPDGDDAESVRIALALRDRVAALARSAGADSPAAGGGSR